MNVLVVSRLGLHTRFISALRRYGVKGIIDYYTVSKEYKNTEDIIKTAEKHKCKAIAVIANWSLAVQLLAKGFKPVFVIVPQYFTTTEIVSGRIYVLDGEVKITAEDV